MSETAEGPKYYLEHVHLKGFKSIYDLSIDLKEGFNIVVGANGAGKSNFLQFLNDAIGSLYGWKSVVFKYAGLCFVTHDNDHLVFDIEQLVLRYPFDDGVDEESSLSKKLKVNGQLAFDNFNYELNPKEVEVNSGSILLGRTINTVFTRLKLGKVFPLYIRFTMPQDIPGVDTPTSIQIPLYSDWNNWEIDFGLDFLYDLVDQIENDLNNEFNERYGADFNSDKNKRRSIFLLGRVARDGLLQKLVIDEGIVENLVRFSPIKGVRFNENINIYSDDKQITVENLKLDYLINDRWIPWSQLSDGTKRLFYIISEVTYKKNGIILIEEPELGVHPHQFELLMQFLKEQSKYKQFIISTHSPKTLDHLDEDELDRILITTYEKDKGTILKRLSEDQKSKAKEYMKEVGFLSDYWLMSDLEG